MADIFEEVDEEVRRDQFTQIWDKYGKVIIAGLVLIIGSTVGYVAWTKYQLSQQLRYSDEFAAALDQIEAKKDADAALSLAALAGEANAGYATLARFREAVLKANGGDRDGAVALFLALAEDRDVDPLYAGLARLYAVMHRLDSGDPETLSVMLEPLLAANGAWRFSARELSALLALRKGDTEAARGAYTGLADDPRTPSGIRARAAEMLRALKS